jgi:hypothetical protein
MIEWSTNGPIVLWLSGLRVLTVCSFLGVSNDLLADSTFLVLEIAAKYHKMLDFVSFFIDVDVSRFLIRLTFLF